MMAILFIITMGFMIILLIIQANNRMASATEGMVMFEGSDGRGYYVVEGSTEEQAADMLVDVVAKSTALIKRVSSMDLKQVSADMGVSVKRLRCISETRDITFMEHRPALGEPVAVNIDKGMSIKLCLFDQNGNVVTKEALFTIVVHELAHIMEVEVSEMKQGHSVHSDAFKRNEAFLMKHAAAMGYVPVGGAVGSAYCGITIPSAEGAQ
jgi:hypothetical protein